MVTNLGPVVNHGHQVRGKPRPKMSSGVKFKFNPTKHKVVLSRLRAVHLFLM